ncbi:MAG TPA: hypothetical protein VEL07_20365 [Planctomycetota bacterium]|nr:hypothetical protein [Planctomycetota bacterium]
MARAQHRFRQVRLDSTRAIHKQCRIDNKPRKTAERERRDARIIAVIKAAKGTDFSPAVKSWITARLGKQWRQVQPSDITSLVA